LLEIKGSGYENNGAQLNAGHVSGRCFVPHWQRSFHYPQQAGGSEWRITASRNTSRNNTINFFYYNNLHNPCVVTPATSRSTDAALQGRTSRLPTVDATASKVTGIIVGSA
ncbi:MAG: hypothetical protein WBN81_14475, partial [Gammaproteobacteria bacterium]